MNAYLGSGIATFLLLITWDAKAALSTVSAVGVKFVASGPGGVSIVGETDQLRVNDDGHLIAIACPLDTLHTGIGLRDRHMKEKYLEVDKYPKAELRVARGALAFPPADGKAARDARGELTLHGRTKPLTFHYVATRVGSGYKLSAEFRINMSDFGIEVPSYLGVTVKPEIEVRAQFQVQGS
jgi:polyisoprenoid-binding protein YceI